MSSKHPNSSTTTITADDIATIPDYDPEERGSPNETDYEFPTGWGLFPSEDRSMWFERERSFRQASRQNTAFGRAYEQAQEDEERIDSDQFRVDDEDLT